jgi:hypothetical protein
MTPDTTTAYPLFRESPGYVKRRGRFIAALERYLNDTVDANDFKNLKELMVSAYDHARYVRSVSSIRHWYANISNSNISNAVIDAADATTSGKTHSLAYEVQKVEALSKSIYNYLIAEAFKAGYEDEKKKREKTEGLTIYTPPSRKTM